MADRIVTAEKAARTPNWNKWRRMRKPALWECVALSLNIDPDKLKRDAFGFPERISDEFRDRIDVTCATLRERHPADCAPIVQRSPLRLAKFTAWVREFEWDAPLELREMADERPQDVNWDYWGALDLRPLDAACKLISGDNPNAPTRRGDIESPDITNRPEWVNMYHQAVSAIKAGNLSVVNGEVTPAEFIAWAQAKGRDAPRGAPLELLAMADEQVAIKADRAHSEERARMPKMDLSHSKFIPLSVLHRALERDKYLIEKALLILSVEDPESPHTETAAVSELLNHWLVNRALDYYINGQRGDDFTALTVIPVNGDYGRGLAALETWIMIDKEELVRLLISRNLKVPGILRKQPDDQTPAAEESAATAASHDTAAAAANPFAAMDGLTWADIAITFIEPGAVRVRARSRTETFTFEGMGFKHRTSRMAKPNRCWSLLRALAIVSTSDKTLSEVCPTHNLKRGMARLRDQLQLFFRIRADPIVFKKGDGYQPAFNLTIEEHVIRKVREQYPGRASEDEGEDEGGDDW